jgi:hypothetical protein
LFYSIKKNNIFEKFEFVILLNRKGIIILITTFTLPDKETTRRTRF